MKTVIQVVDLHKIKSYIILEEHSIMAWCIKRLLSKMSASLTPSSLLLNQVPINTVRMAQIFGPLHLEMGNPDGVLGSWLQQAQLWPLQPPAE